MFEVNYGVWKRGSGWQPHDVKSEEFHDLDAACRRAGAAVEEGHPLGQIIATVRYPDGTIASEYGWSNENETD